MGFKEILEKDELEFKDIIYLLKIKERSKLEELYRTANEVRENHVKSTTCVHGIIEFSNYCRQNCLYCGIRRDGKIERYRMEPEEIIACAESAHKLGYKMLVLQSGEDLWYTPEKLEEIVRGVREKCRLLIFLSIGDRDFETYKRLREAGAHGVLFRFETSNNELFERLRPGTAYYNRVKHLEWMGKLRYLIASGGMVGLPGQSIESIARDILLVKLLKVNMASFGPYICHSQTPLAGNQNGNLDLALKTIAVLRLAYKDLRIPVTTALETLDRNGRELGLKAGANSVMINLTPLKYRKLYSIYPNKAGIEEEIEKATDEAMELIHSLGRRVCKGYGPNYPIPSFAPVCE